MGSTARPSSTRTRTLDRSALLIPGGLAVLAAGKLLFLAGEYAWLGAPRSTDYFGPALLLSPDSDGYRSLAVGALIFVIGLAVLLAGVFRLAAVVDTAARNLAPSALFVTGGLFVLVIGSLLSEAGHLAALRSQGILGAHATGQILGTTVAVAGFGLLLGGVYRLVRNSQAIATASTRASVSATA